MAIRAALVAGSFVKVLLLPAELTSCAVGAPMATVTFVHAQPWAISGATDAVDADSVEIPATFHRPPFYATRGTDTVHQIGLVSALHTPLPIAAAGVAVAHPGLARIGGLLTTHPVEPAITNSGKSIGTCSNALALVKVVLVPTLSASSIALVAGVAVGRSVLPPCNTPIRVGYRRRSRGTVC